MERVIQESVKQIPIWQLRDAAVRSLRNFANKQYNTLFRALGLPSAFLMLIASVIDESIPAKQREVIARQIELNYSENIPVGVPLQTYAKQYTEEKLKPVLDELSTQNALDPDDVSGRNSLRNRAEMEVRYDDHLESISKLKEDGNKLVIASSHADCSKRCSPWQGRVYSLDGTSGTTPDGRKFVPLEEATDIYYTTKAGRTYKNGLLGFNCRHYLMPYKDGLKPPKPNKELERKEREITQRQRELERNVRLWRTRALEYKNVDYNAYRQAKEQAIKWNKYYIEFSKNNGRAYYPSRTKLI